MAYLDPPTLLRYFIFVDDIGYFPQVICIGDAAIHSRNN
ncbi:hypothetical protein CGLO_13527 [Colletotrichum gloeosporioides Cg-14]|uniref:Uncharacterized protein n=1 Tax=Colletotrichum gloeosporioides (strain Cg-14) TaxID=1237896 RepID=T0LGJ2_COLGC|nr:hypothetical protein CGLO_13527 [Colletotrichum gloeosporioides Cg-14]